jgi:hypothetical protein
VNSLSARRCLRHPQREAVALCPACEKFFCRECISEHKGRILCSRCLSAAIAPKRRSRRILKGFVELVAAGLGLMLIWLLFFYFGQMLLALPSSFHEGTLWSAF